MVGKKHVHPKKYRKIGKNRRKHLFWEKGLTLYVGYGMNDVDDVC